MYLSSFLRGRKGRGTAPFPCNPSPKTTATPRKLGRLHRRLDRPSWIRGNPLSTLPNRTNARAVLPTNTSTMAAVIAKTIRRLRDTSRLPHSKNCQIFSHRLGCGDYKRRKLVRTPDSVIYHIHVRMMRPHGEEK